MYCTYIGFLYAYLCQYTATYVYGVWIHQINHSTIGYHRHIRRKYYKLEIRDLLDMYTQTDCEGIHMYIRTYQEYTISVAHICLAVILF